MPPALASHILVMSGVLLTAYGLVQMLFGYRLYRVWATLQGIGLGAATAVVVSARYFPDYPLLHYFVGLVGAGLGAILFYYVSVFLYGAGLGLAVTLVIHTAWLLNQSQQWILPSLEAIQQSGWIYASAGVGTGLLALALRRPFLIVITSLGGAAMAVLGAACAAPPPSSLPKGNLTFILVTTGITFVALAIVAIIVQWRTSDVPLDIFAADNAAAGKSKPKDKKPSPDEE